MKALSRFLTLFFAAALSAPSASYAQWVQTNGPYGGVVNSLAVSGADVFAGGNGVFRSTDNGTSWTAVDLGLTNLSVSALAVSGTNLFAGILDGGVFLSTDNGTSWTPANTGLTDKRVRTLALSGTDLFAGTDHGVFLSRDNGASWTPAGLAGNLVGVLAVSGTNLYAGSVFDGIHRSTDGGVSWTSMNAGFTTIRVNALGSIPNGVGGRDVFAGTDGGIFRSTDDDTAWTATEFVGSTGHNAVECLAFYPDGFGGTTLLAGGDGIVRSTDDGASWTRVYTGKTDLNLPIWALAVSADGAGGTNIFAGSNGEGVYLSTDNAATWTQVNTGLTDTYFRAFAVKGSNIFVGSQHGIFRSADSGTSWTRVDSGLVYPVIRALAVSGTNIFAGVAGTGVFRSSDDGASWKRSMELFGQDIRALAVIPRGPDGANLYAGHGLNGGVSLSTDNGTSWIEDTAGLPIVDVYALAPLGTTLFAGTYGDGVYRFTDGGTSWTQTGLTNGSIQALAVSGENLFAGGFGVSLSTDNGTSWTPLNAAPPFGVLALAISGRNLFAGTSGGGVFLSSNNGTSWTDVSTGLASSDVAALAVFGSDLFAGTKGGVWKRPLSEMIRFAITVSSGGNGTVSPSGPVLVVPGGDAAFTMHPDTGYHVDSIFADGSYVGPVTSYAFTNVTTDHSIAATFAINRYAITATAGTHGGITPSGTVAVTYGGGRSFIIRPDTGCHVDSVVVDGSLAGNDTIYTFTNVTADHTIRAAFRVNQYAITSSAGPNGTITPSGVVTLNFGGAQRYFLQPDSGYHIDSILVDGSFTGTDTVYSFTNVTANHAIRGVFSDQYRITAGSGPNGSIVPSGTVMVHNGQSQSFILRSGAGCRVDSILVDGSFAGTDTVYSFTNVTANHAIRAVFLAPPVTIQIGVKKGWNMVSVPLLANSCNKSVLFSSAVSNAFLYEGTYIVKDTLAGGCGYWLKFNGGQNLVMDGILCVQEATDVKTGWNMIGSISVPLAAASISSAPGGIQTSQFFGYGGKYFPTDTIQPGNGYWVKAAEPGTMILSFSTGLQKPANRIRIVPIREMPPPVPEGEAAVKVFPAAHALAQNYPNPFNPVTTIRYDLPEAVYVSLRVYNLLGQEVATLVNEREEAGFRSVTFDGTNLPSGIYFLKLNAGTFSNSKKMLLLK